MPQSSRVMVTRDASVRNRASSGGAAAVRRRKSGRSAAAEVLCIWQGLLRLAPARKRLCTGAVEQFVDIADAERVPAVVAAELVPRDRRGHRRAFAAAGRIRQHRRRAALVPQPVEEDAALALFLADVGGEHLRLSFRDGATEPFGEALDRGPVLRGVERYNDVEALAPGKQREAFQTQSLQQLAEQQGRLFDVTEIQPDVGIEIEHQPVGTFDLVDLASPAVELDRPHLDAGKQPLDVADVEIVLEMAVLF